MLLISRGLVLYKLLYQASHGEILLPRLCGFHCCMPLPATSISALRFGLSVVQRLLTLWKSSGCAFLIWWTHSDFYIMSSAFFFFLSWSHAADPVVRSGVRPDVFQVRDVQSGGQFSTWSLLFFPASFGSCSWIRTNRRHGRISLPFTLSAFPQAASHCSLSSPCIAVVALQILGSGTT